MATEWVTVPTGSFTYVSGGEVMDSKKAIVLLSGGLDSTTVAALATRRDGYECTAISFDYGQRHRAELRSARMVCEALSLSGHLIVPLPSWGGSALNSDTEVVKDRPISAMSDGIPDTYVPARNTVFLAFAAAFAESMGADRIYAGMNALDYSGYPDCRPGFIAAFQEVLDLGTKIGDETGDGPEIITPLIDLTKSEIITLGTEYGAPYNLTHSCYDPITTREFGEVACGRCDSCTLRLKGFDEAGIPDPVPYYGVTA